MVEKSITVSDNSNQKCIDINVIEESVFITLIDDNERMKVMYNFCREDLKQLSIYFAELSTHLS